MSDKQTGELIAVCLCCGPSLYYIEVPPSHQHQRIATRMLERALTVGAGRGVREFHAWRCDGTHEAKLYGRVGFRWTDETEG